MERVTIGRADLYFGDCRELSGRLDADAVISDPPYGMAWNTNSCRFSGGETSKGRVRGREWARVRGDDEDFDPLPWLDFPRVVLFGSNHYGQKLPAGTTLVWVKRVKFGTFLSDAEIAWMKGGHGVYCYQDVSMNGKGANFQSLHPTQKPAGLMAWCMERAKVPSGGVVIDPYMGSGTSGVAAIETGRRFIGVEIVREYFDVACERIDQAQRQMRMFA